MFLINCPYCGERDQSEFSNGGEAHVVRPKDPDSVSDKEWSEYVFFRSNPKGIFNENFSSLFENLNKILTTAKTKIKMFKKQKKI